ncbi:Ger(x)C family spore germination protein [bacterium LRH843]|nr:Ger(x)C family spore germination protein [bacterium LRH843]
MKHIHVIVILILTTPFFSGCVHTNIVDEVQLIHALGFDYVTDNKVKAVASVPVFKSNKQISSEIISATGVASRVIRLQINSKSPKPVHTGKLNVIIFTEMLSDKLGIFDIIDTFSRDPTIGKGIYLAITSKTTDELFSLSNPLERDIAVDIQKTIRQNMESQNIPITNFHRFLRQYYEIGQDPYLPHVRRNGNFVEVDGVALLKGDRFVHKLGLKEAFLMKSLIERIKYGTYEAGIKGENEYAVIRNVKSKSDYSIEKNTNTPKISITINIRGEISEYTGSHLDQEKIREVNRTFKSSMESDTKKMIKLFQEKEIDPIGLGSRVRSSNRQFNLDDWKEYYKDAEVDVNVNVTIVGTGITDETSRPNSN